MSQPIPKPQLDQIEASLALDFDHKELLVQALTHRSYLNEHKSERLPSYERLEFLGDAVLELWVSTQLYNLFPESPEGILTNLRSKTVCTETFSSVSKTLHLDQYLLLSNGEEKNGGRTNKSLLADVFEALVGAIYLDKGIKYCGTFLEKTLTSVIKEISSLKTLKDPKSYFQELSQAKFLITPHYVTLKEEGPDHKKHFLVAVFVGEQQMATGEGNSKLAAEEDASQKATLLLETKVQ